MHDEMKNMFSLKGKVAMVTGGAVNLGFDAACVLAAAASDIVITSRTIAKAEKSAVELKEKYNVNVLPLQLDHTDHNEVRDVFAEAVSWQGHLDILVNNAGGGSLKTTGNFLESVPESIAELIDVNLNGAIYCCREAGRIMTKQNKGKIINIASIAGLLGRDRRMYARNGMSGQPVEYAAAKAGIIGLTLDLAGYLSPMGINVNCISPGGTKGKESDLPEGFVKDYSERTPMGRFGEYGKDIKGGILFLASSASDYVTGHNLVIDGGFSIWR